MTVCYAVSEKLILIRFGKALAQIYESKQIIFATPIDNNKFIYSILYIYRILNIIYIISSRIYGWKCCWDANNKIPWDSFNHWIVGRSFLSVASSKVNHQTFPSIISMTLAYIYPKPNEWKQMIQTNTTQRDKERERKIEWERKRVRIWE